jgi:chaperone required for assembly of F1-ATPase
VKRFYKETAAVPAEGGFAVTLDGKAIRTPAKQPLVVPTRALAEAIAAEWQAQDETVRPDTMPMMRLASIALDIVEKRRDQVVAEVAKYAETDLVCYRTPDQPALAARQQEAWHTLLDWATLEYDAPLAVTSGIVPVPQPAAALKAMEGAVAGYDTFGLTALHAATTACGSLVIGLALVERRIDAAAAFAASQLDETFQIEQWGEDEIQTRRRAALRRDIEAAAHFLELARRG